MKSTDQIARRSDPRRRRSLLRDLDLVLGKEIRDAGTLSCGELFEVSEKPLRGKASRATITEWWEYAYRRGWLEEHGPGRCRLTSTANDDLHATHRREAGPDYLNWAKSLLRWAATAGLFGTVAILTQRNLSVYVTVFVWVMATASALAIGGLITRPIAAWMNCYFARRACDWLDGRRLRVPPLPAVDPGAVRRAYAVGEFCAPGHAELSEAGEIADPAASEIPA